nr:exosortase/archaeosortase family protein [Candidatus Nanohalobium constans]
MAKLLVVGAIFQGILYIHPNTEFLQSFLAEIIGAMLNSTGTQTTVNGISLLTSKAEYIITQDCLGWKSIAAFYALTFASTKRTLEHLNYLLQGTAVIIIANIIRVYTTVVLAEKGIVSFDLIHDVLWSWSLTFLVLAMWAYWMLELKDRKPIFQQRIQERVREFNRE